MVLVSEKALARAGAHLTDRKEMPVMEHKGKQTLIGLYDLVRLQDKHCIVIQILIYLSPDSGTVSSPLV